MKRRFRTQSAAAKSETNTYLRYLKPGALAQLRDSKINARSNLRPPDHQIYLHRASPSPPTSPPRSFNPAGIIQPPQPEVTGALSLTIADGELPFLASGFNAPRCLQRKKLMAVRSMCCLTHNPSSLTSDGPVPVIDVL